MKLSNTLRDITFFPFLPKRPKFSVPFVWFTCVRLHVERKRKIYRYKSILLSMPKNIPVPFDGKFFTEISVQMVSAPCLNCFLLFGIHYHALPYKDKIEPQHRHQNLVEKRFGFVVVFSVRVLHTALHYLNAWNRLLARPATRTVACSKRSDSGERCGVEKAMKSRGGLPRFYFFALPFTLHRSPLSERLEQASRASSKCDI